MKNINSISIIIPAYNEEKRLPRSLDKILDFVKKHKVEYEIIVIDDGSSDDTRTIVEGYMKKDKNIRLNKKRNNKGKGYSIKEGMLMARKEIRVFTDADFSTPIYELERFDKYVKNFPIIIGIRTKDSIKIKQPLIRVIAGRVFNLAVRLISGLKIKDSQCGFKLFSRDSSNKIFSRLKTNGWAFDVEVLLRAKKEGFKIKAVPVEWIDDKRSRVNLIKDSLKMLKEIIKIKLMISKEYRSLRR